MAKARLTDVSRVETTKTAVIIDFDKARRRFNSIERDRDKLREFIARFDGVDACPLKKHILSDGDRPIIQKTGRITKGEAAELRQMLSDFRVIEERCPMARSCLSSKGMIG